jgi:hypothetical protein
MIIESGFFKLAEVLMSYDDKDGVYESNVANLLSSSIILELNARNINNPLNYIQLEKRYSRNENSRCDIYCDFRGVIDSSKMKTYMINEENWIEAKYYGSLYRTKGTETKVDNIGAILLDIYRLITKIEDQSNQIGKYLLVVFNDRPEKYLAFNRMDRSERNWLKELFTSGISKWCCELEEEPKSITRFFKGEEISKIVMETRTTCFEPYGTESSLSGFWGYLIQILGSEII